MELNGFEIRYRKLYICFYDKKSFFVVKLLKFKLQVEFGKKKDVKVFKEIKGVRDISNKDWNHVFFNSKNMTNNYQNGGGNDEQEDIKEVMENQRIDADQAEKVRDVVEEYNVSEEEAMAIVERKFGQAKTNISL